MDDLQLINNTSVYRNPAPQSPLQGQNVMQPAAVYSKIMLKTIELAESDYTFDGLAVERTMPSNNGSNEIVFKRMLSLAAHTQPLVEGIPPASDQGRMVALKATATSYGRVMKFTDKVNWAVVDPLISEYTRQLSLKVPETKDLLAQQALLSECQVFYAQPKKPVGETATNPAPDPDVLTLDKTAPAVNHIKYLTQSCNPTIDEFRKIVLSMEAAKVRPYQGSNFLVLASSAVIFDLITDRRVKEYMKYASTGSAYTNDMVLDLFSLAFKKAKTIKSDNTYTSGDGTIRYLYTNGTNNLSLHKPITDYDNYGTGTITLIPANGDEAIVCATQAAMSLTSNALTSCKAYEPLNVHYSFVLGEECLYRIGVEGHTAPQFIKKELGSAGTEDPLNQRQSIGWKIDSLGYKVPNPDAVVAYMSIPTQYKINMNQRPDLKNQFTDYNYGYVDANGKYFYPEQVIQSVKTVWDDENSVNVTSTVYYVRGTTVEVEPIRMTQLVKPVSTGRVNTNGKIPQVVGTTPTMGFILNSSIGTANPIRFAKDQVEMGADGYYIKGLTTTAAAKVTPLGAPDVNTAFKQTNGVEDIDVIDNGISDLNKTGDSRID